MVERCQQARTVACTVGVKGTVSVVTKKAIVTHLQHAPHLSERLLVIIIDMCA
jgi:hypothetical protein